jgi:hypothetical protein
MSTVLFKSWHALAAAILVAAFFLWSSAATDGASIRTFQLASGWGALALFLIVLGYVLRKYVHKLGISPEFKMKVPIEKLEKAESRLSELRVQMASGRLVNRSDILKRANAILRQEGVRWVVKVRLEDGTASGQVLRALPTGPLGGVAHWLRVHLYYGIAAAFLVGLHGRFALHSGISVLLNGFTFLVILSGLVGIVLWAAMPRLLTEAERDLSIEKAHALRESLDRKIEAAYAVLDPATRAIFRDVDRVGDRFPQHAAAALKAAPQRADGDRLAEDLMALLGQRHGVRREWESLMRIKRKMNLWRVVHIPGALILMSIVAIHVVSVLWY